jgi:hypothetical protein
VRLSQGFFRLLGAEADDQGALPDAQAELAVEQEADAKHLLLLDPLLACEGLPDAGSEGSIECHRQPPASLASQFRVFYPGVDEGPQAEVLEELGMNLSPV